ncbi:hypothetical protein [Dyella sp. 2RAB6]|uniref:hypothetical protein n=1 Tax=Dyella sp. 2RAB6 TaxID=3232992 RepID=UPI003F919A71
MIKWLIFFITTAITVVCMGDRVWWPERKFDPEAWKRTESNGRYVYATDLLDSRVLIGKSEDEVIALLGESDLPRYAATIQYLIRHGGVGLRRIYILDLRFTNGKVSRAFVRDVG